MADAAVEFLLETLKQLLVYHVNLIRDAKKQVEQLQDELQRLNAYLNDSTKKMIMDESSRDFLRRIRKVVYEVEDIIDEFVTQAIQNKSKNFVLKCCGVTEQVNIAKDVLDVLDKVKRINSERENLDLARNWDVGDGRSDETNKVNRKEPREIVGLQDQVEDLLPILTRDTKELDVISISGMPGLGKTTLAQKIFHDPAIYQKFPTLIWVDITQQFTSKNVFLDILKQIPTVTEDTDRKTVEELSQLVASHLEVGTFLIVMDDVWRREDWNVLQIALPKRIRMGKVLITGREKPVDWDARIRHQHELRFLNEQESWSLLQLEVFGNTGCPHDLEALGELIACQCGGLPLQIVVIGGILLKKFSESKVMSAKVKAWEEVSQSVSKYLDADPQRHIQNIISLSYLTLPFHLRTCFLYLAMFPQDFEIPVRKLIRMWIAEGFIKKKFDFSLEETAENYFQELVNRNLIKIDKFKPNGKAGTCRIHDTVRAFCKITSGNEMENFLQEIKKSNNDGDFDPPISDVHMYRRLCIHSNISDFISGEPNGRHVRSFVCFSKEDTNLNQKNCSTIPAAFKLLRVLDIKPIRFTEALPSDLYKLVHLRYITLSFNSSILPKAISNLWNIQTLVVDTTSRTLEIKADIWKLIQLRYLKTNASATLPKPSKTCKDHSKLQRLGTISPQNCTEEVFDRVKNLKKLDISGKLSLLLDGNKSTGSFDSLGKLSNLEKLKLLNDVYPTTPSEGKLHSLPPPLKFPPRLRSLTLSATFLNWDTHMSILGLLENLEVLKLKDKAFMGQRWMVANGCFRNLELLHIGGTDLMSWEASGHHFPKLRRVELWYCEKLKQIPVGLADIPTFEALDLYETKHAAASAKEIHNAKQKKHLEQTMIIGVFKLSIYPPDE